VKSMKAISFGGLARDPGGGTINPPLTPGKRSSAAPLPLPGRIPTGWKYKPVRRYQDQLPKTKKKTICAFRIGFRVGSSRLIFF
ncbi:hypothetical protein CEXT_409341, partial [Caerostris extrusa]